MMAIRKVLRDRDQLNALIEALIDRGLWLAAELEPERGQRQGRMEETGTGAEAVARIIRLEEEDEL
jgi:hypothetical protein